MSHPPSCFSRLARWALLTRTVRMETWQGKLEAPYGMRVRFGSQKFYHVLPIKCDISNQMLLHALAIDVPWFPTVAHWIQYLWALTVAERHSLGMKAVPKLPLQHTLETYRCAVPKCAKSGAMWYYVVLCGTMWYYICGTIRVANDVVTTTLCLPKWCDQLVYNLYYKIS